MCDINSGIQDDVNPEIPGLETLTTSGQGVSK